LELFAGILFRSKASSSAQGFREALFFRIKRCYYRASLVEDHVMRTTLALDDELLAKAQAFTGLKEKSALVREALKALIERESARRLARLGGSERKLTTAPRRRPEPA
jgi:Arc/MetJ family transcription regulator